MNEDKLTAQEVMQETGWTFCKDNEEATRKETEAAVDYVIFLYEQCIQQIEEQARLLSMSAERELSLLAEIETKEKELAKYRKLAQLVLEARLPIKPVRNLDGSLENFTVRIAGKLHRCECGCNVFHKPDDKNLDLYECNACGQQFEAE